MAGTHQGSQAQNVVRPVALSCVNKALLLYYYINVCFDYQTHNLDHLCRYFDMQNCFSQTFDTFDTSLLSVWLRSKTTYLFFYLSSWLSVVRAKEHTFAHGMHAIRKYSW